MPLTLHTKRSKRKNITDLIKEVHLISYRKELIFVLEKWSFIYGCLARLIFRELFSGSNAAPTLAKATVRSFVRSFAFFFSLVAFFLRSGVKNKMS